MRFFIILLILFFIYKYGKNIDTKVEKSDVPLVVKPAEKEKDYKIIKKPLRKPNKEVFPAFESDWSTTEQCQFSWVESSGGTNRVHSVLKTGAHKGTRAVSSYGLMPLTVKELLKIKTFRNSKIGKLVAQAKNPKEINDITEKEKFDNYIFHVLRKNYKDRVKSKVSSNHWYMVSVLAHYKGVVGAIKYYKKYEYEGVLNHTYVKKFIKFKNRCY